LVPLLLAHPDIDVNVKNNGGQTPLLWACHNGHPSCVREMLKDSRKRTSPTFLDALQSGLLLVMAILTSSGGGSPLEEKPGDVYKTDAIGAAKNWGKAEVVTLLERFKVMLPRPDMR